MKEIKDLDGIQLTEYTLNDWQLQAPESNIDPKKGQFRIPLIFLLDISGTMDEYKDDINSVLNELVSDVHNSKGGEKYMVDLAIITFGGNGVVIRRPFDILDKEENFQDNFQIDACGGSTPLGVAMLQAYYYAAKRKQIYKKAEVDYHQPTVVLISDIRENDQRFSNVVIDGVSYQPINSNSKRSELFEEMAELYNFAYNNRKQFTYFIGIGDVDRQNYERLGVYSMDGTGNITQALSIVMECYFASFVQTNPREVIEYASELDMGYLRQWQSEAYERGDDDDFDPLYDEDEPYNPEVII